MKKFFTFIAVAAMAFAAQANVLTVADGGYDGGYQHPGVPIYGLWVDTENTMSQVIYPADMLTDMVGSEITELKFTTTAYWYETYVGEGESEGVYGAFIAFDNATIQLSLKVVEEDAFEAGAIEGATVVATTVPVKGDDHMTFVLDEPFVYEGGNLLVECKVIEPGDWGTTYFLGSESPVASCYYAYDGYSGWTEYTDTFLPMATFTYEEGDVPPVEPTYEGYWIVLIDKDGNEIPYLLNPGENTDYATTVSLDYNTFGTFDYYGGEERPVVGFYFIVDDVKYGAPEDMTATVLGTALDNPLSENMNYYTVPVGYSYTLGIFVDDMTGEYYVYAAQGGYTGVNELVNGKTVAGVRYFNMAGQEMKEANGMTIVVTTYTDGTSSAVKVMK